MTETPPRLPAPVPGLRDYAAPLAVLLLLYAGYFKANPFLSWVPMDLTLLGALLALAGIAAVLVTSLRLPRGAVIVLAVWLTFLPAAFHFSHSEYGASKTSALLTLTFASALAPIFLLRSQRRLELWVLMQIALGTVLAAGALESPGQSSDSLDRLSLAGSNAITSGRAAGVAAVGCFVLALTGHRRRSWLTALGAALTVPLFLSGSRGPVMAAGIAVLVVAVFAPTSRARRWLRVLFVFVLGTLVYLCVRTDTSGGVGRITSTLLTGDTQGTSSQSRVSLWSDATSYITSHFGGTGWGGLQDVSGFDLLGNSKLVYPHNLLLEVFGEAGWIAGTATILFLYFGLRRLRRAAVSPYAATLYGMAVYSVVNVMVSGDVNSAKIMWASVAVAWAITATHETGGSSPESPGDRQTDHRQTDQRRTAGASYATTYAERVPSGTS